MKRLSITHEPSGDLTFDSVIDGIQVIARFFGPDRWNNSEEYVRLYNEANVVKCVQCDGAAVYKIKMNSDVLYWVNYCELHASNTVLQYRVAELWAL